jgi:hypothetical protein
VALVLKRIEMSEYFSDDPWSEYLDIARAIKMLPSRQLGGLHCFTWPWHEAKVDLF